MFSKTVSSLCRYYRLRDFDRYKKQYDADKNINMMRFLSQYFRKNDIEGYKNQVKYGIPKH